MDQLKTAAYYHNIRSDRRAGADTQERGAASRSLKKTLNKFLRDYNGYAQLKRENNSKRLRRFGVHANQNWQNIRYRDAYSMMLGVYRDRYHNGRLRQDATW